MEYILKNGSTLTLITMVLNSCQQMRQLEEQGNENEPNEEQHGR